MPLVTCIKCGARFSDHPAVGIHDCSIPQEIDGQIELFATEVEAPLPPEKVSE